MAEETKTEELRRPRTPPPVAGHILVVDDQEMNRDLLLRRLTRQGHTTCMAGDGVEALEALARERVDLVLLDVMMPRLDGVGVLTAMKEHPEWRNLPVIMISAATDLELIVKCIQMGAADYLSKPFNPVLLRARVDACLEKKALRDREQQAFRALQESQAALAAELAEAAAYLTSLLPARLEGEVTSDWVFEPSTRLGGDGFGYRWLDPDRLACYLLDVSGHGVGAALLAVSVMNAIGSGTLAADLGAPAQVLRALNEAFPMERHNNMYFTAWYGVYDRREARLRYSSGGHPPALLMTPGEGGPAPTSLGAPGFVIGGMPDVEFEEAGCAVPPGSRLHLFSDGAYEVTLSDGGEMQVEDLAALLLEPVEPGASQAASVLAKVRARHGAGPLDDDFSLLTLAFGQSRGSNP